MGRSIRFPVLSSILMSVTLIGCSSQDSTPVDTSWKALYGKSWVEVGDKSSPYFSEKKNDYGIYQVRNDEPLLVRKGFYLSYGDFCVIERRVEWTALGGFEEESSTFTTDLSSYGALAVVEVEWFGGEKPRQRSLRVDGERLIVEECPTGTIIFVRQWEFLQGWRANQEDANVKDGIRRLRESFNQAEKSKGAG